MPAKILEAMIDKAIGGRWSAAYKQPVYLNMFRDLMNDIRYQQSPSATTRRSAMSLLAENLIPLSLSVNGRPYQLSVTGNTRLLDLLRQDLGLTGTKEGCAVGECGACTVVMDSEAVCSCMILAAQCQDSQIVTIEGLKDDPLAQQLQQSFIKRGGVQCGFCTPGVLMSTWALLKKYQRPSQQQVLDALEGNLVPLYGLSTHPECHQCCH